MADEADDVSKDTPSVTEPDSQDTGPSCWQTIGVWGHQLPRCPELARVSHCRNCEVYEAAGRRMFLRPPPDDYGLEWAAALAELPPAESTEYEAAVVFRTGGELLALPASCVVEVLEWRTIRRIPHVREEAILGFVHVSGEMHLCLSLEVMFGAPRPDLREPSPRARLIAVGSGKTEWIVPVEETFGMPQVRLDTLEPVPVTLFKAETTFVRGFFSYREQRVGLIDAELLLGTLRRRMA